MPDPVRHSPERVDSVPATFPPSMQHVGDLQHRSAGEALFLHLQDKQIHPLAAQRLSAEIVDFVNSLRAFKDLQNSLAPKLSPLVNNALK